MSLTGELIKHFEHVIESVAVMPSDGGKFEVSVNGNLIFSKLDSHRHPNPGEVVDIISKMVNQ